MMVMIIVMMMIIIIIIIHFEEGAMKLKTGYPLVPQDHGFVSTLRTLSKHYVRMIIVIIIIIINILRRVVSSKKLAML